jgi:hypothetical protein
MGKTETVVKPTSNDILADILLQERVDKQQAAQEVKTRNADALERRKQQELGMLDIQNRVYSNCDHLQGNHKPGEAPFREISHLSMHTFFDKTRRIRCNKCGFRWRPGDTDKTITRQGITSTNPTGISWKDANKIVQKFVTVGNKPSKGFLVIDLAPSGVE